MSVPATIVVKVVDLAGPALDLALDRMPIGVDSRNLPDPDWADPELNGSEDDLLAAYGL